MKSLEQAINFVSDNGNLDEIRSSLAKPEEMSRAVYLRLLALSEQVGLAAARGEDCADGFDERGAEIDRLMTASPWTAHPDYGVVPKSDVKFLDAGADNLPPWATGMAKGWTDIGAQLCTKDGRRIGNAVLIGSVELHGRTFYQVVTDIGTTVRFTEEELGETFYQPVYTMAIDTHAGYLRYSAASNARKQQ